MDFLRQLSDQSLLPPVTPLKRCTIADGTVSLAGGGRGVRIHPVSPSVKHVLDFLQLKSDVLLVNTLKGYMAANLRGHTIAQGKPMSLDPSIRRWIKGLEHTKDIT